MWIKRMLLVLLFGFTASGFILGARHFHQSSSGTAKTSDETLFHKPGLFSKAASAGKKTPIQPKGAIICNGTVISESGYGLAVINGRAVPSGSIVDGVKIIQITGSNILIESDGKTVRLAPGEIFVPKKH